MPPIKGKMFNYSEEQMNNAIADVKKGTPIATAAKRYSVPRITLMYKAKGKTPTIRRMGPDPILKKEEEIILVEWIITVAKAGFPITKIELFDSVQQLIKELNRQNPFVDNRPGRTWFDAFLKRHSNLSSRIAQNLTSSRAAVTKEALSGWFKEIDLYLTENNYKDILEHPERVFNLDETAFFLNPKGNKVLAPKGEKNIYQQVNMDEKECLTVLITGNASGTLAPPLVVFKYARIPCDLADSVPKHWGIGKSENGWMTGPLFFEFITNIFHPFLIENNITLPVIVFVDGHASHLTLHTSKFCEENGIILIALLPNSTHLIQPMDVAVFRVLKEAWKKKTHQWRIRHLDRPTLKKIHFSPLLEETLAESIAPSILQNGFRKCGLVPWNPEAVDFSKIPTRDTTTPCTISTTPRTTDNLQTGLAILEQYIEQGTLQNFLASPDEWIGNSCDHSLFRLWKKMKRDCDNQNKSIPDIVQNNETNNEDNQTVITTQDCDNENIAADMVKENTTGDQKSYEVGITGMEAQSGVINSEDQDLTKNSEMSETNVNVNESITLDGKTIPAPFKRALFWPEPTEKLRKRKSKEKNTKRGDIEAVANIS